MNNKHSLIGNELNEKQMELNYNQNNDSIAKVLFYFFLLMIAFIVKSFHTHLTIQWSKNCI